MASNGLVVALCGSAHRTFLESRLSASASRRPAFFAGVPRLLTSLKLRGRYGGVSLASGCAARLVTFPKREGLGKAKLRNLVVYLPGSQTHDFPDRLGCVVGVEGAQLLYALRCPFDLLHSVLLDGAVSETASINKFSRSQRSTFSGL
jgi:hypothetical protein